VDLFLKAFDLFINTAKELADYVPQSGSDVLHLFQQLGNFAVLLNNWLAVNVGLNVQSVLISLGKLILLGLTFVIDLLKQLVNRI